MKMIEHICQLTFTIYLLLYTQDIDAFEFDIHNKNEKHRPSVFDRKVLARRESNLIEKKAKSSLGSRAFNVLYLFYHCPRVKLFLDLQFYLMFLCMYAYFLVVELNENVHISLESVLIIWGVSVVLQEIRELCGVSEESTFHKVMRHFEEGWNKVITVACASCITFYVSKIVLPFC